MAPSPVLGSPDEHIHVPQKCFLLFGASTEIYHISMSNSPSLFSFLCTLGIFFKSPGKQRFDFNFFLNNNNCNSHCQGKTHTPICITAVLGFMYPCVYGCSLKNSTGSSVLCPGLWRNAHILLKTSASSKYCSTAALSLFAGSWSFGNLLCHVFWVEYNFKVEAAWPTLIYLSGFFGLIFS